MYDVIIIITFPYFCFQWARDLGLKCSPRVRVPVIPAEHFYITTPCFEPELDPRLPCVRDYDSHTYVREWEGGFMVGAFELEAKPAFGGSGIVEDWKNKLPQDWNHISEFLAVVTCRNLDWIDCVCERGS